MREKPPEETDKEGKQGREGKKPKGRAKKVKPQTVYYADTHRIESWLLEQAAERGYAEAIEKMGGPRLRPAERGRP